jgi:hypothetical protein
MKRLHLGNLLLAVPFILLLAACGSTGPLGVETPPPTPTPTQEPTPIPTPELPTGIMHEAFTEEEDRDAYQVWNLDDPDFPGLRDFLEEYEAALAAEELADWLQAPYGLIFYFSHKLTSVSDEIIPYQEIFFLPTASHEESVYIIILGEYLDDSVWGDKIRVEFKQRGRVWEIVWVGNMWRCRRGGPELEETWHTILCP